MQIRRAESEDIPIITTVVEEAYSKYVSRIGRRPAPMDADYEGLVAAGEVWGETDGTVMGVLVIRPSETALELDNVAVAPGYAGRGHGRALIDFAERYASGLGLPAVELYTNEAMVENLALYPRLGFAETGRRLEDGFWRVFFRKSLDAPSSRPGAPVRR